MVDLETQKGGFDRPPCSARSTRRSRANDLPGLHDHRRGGLPSTSRMRASWQCAKTGTSSLREQQWRPSGHLDSGRARWLYRRCRVCGLCLRRRLPGRHARGAAQGGAGGVTRPESSAARGNRRGQASLQDRMTSFFVYCREFRSAHRMGAAAWARSSHTKTRADGLSQRLLLIGG